MRHALTLHPESSCTAVARIDVEVARRGRSLVLHYVMTGNLSDVRLAPVSTSGGTRADKLWRHTCFEAFVHLPGSDGYYEFNLAPSTQWATYRFDAYRSGMSAVAELDAPQMEVSYDAARFELRAHLNTHQLPGLPADTEWRLGLSTVIEETGGDTSYWALAHPPGKPDFHHPDSFALVLPAADHS